MGKNKKTLQAIFYSLSLCFLILVTLPATAYYFNQTDLSLHTLSVLKVFLYSSLPILLITGLIARYLPRVGVFINFFILAFFLYFFIRNFLCPIAFDQLDGRMIVTPSLYSDTSFWTSLGLLSACFLFTYFAKNAVKFIVLLGIFISIGWSSFVFIHNHHNNKTNLTNDIVKFSQFSTKKNIIVISFDALQNNLLLETLETHPEFKKKLDGFTFYINTTSYAPSTNFSLLSTTTSHYLSTGKQGAEPSVFAYRYKQYSVLRNLSQQGFQTDGFGLFDSCQAPAACLSHENILSAYHIASPMFQAYDIALLRVLPKSISWTCVKKLGGIPHKISTTSQNQDIIRIKNDQDIPDFGFDRFAFHHLYQNASLTSKPVFKFHHYLFTHYPIRLDKKCHYHTDIPQNSDTAKNEMICALNEFNHFLTKLKKLTIYDNSLIVFTSDHGYQNDIQISSTGKSDWLASFSNENPVLSSSRYWPILLIKLPESHGEMRINQKPVELVDIAPTIYEAMHLSQYCTSSQCDGTSLIDTDKIPENRVRKAMLYENNQLQAFDSQNANSQTYQTVDIIGDAKQGVFNAMQDLAIHKIRPITCKQAISFNQEMPEFVITEGLANIESWGRWSDGKKTSLFFKLKKTGCKQHIVRLKLTANVTAEHPKQTANVFLNGHNIGQIILMTDKPFPREIVLSYEPSMLNENGLNTLQFDISNPVRLSGDLRWLGLGFYQITFE